MLTYAGLALIDPVVLMLNLKNVLYNFLYKNDGADGIADIIGSELGVNIALRRNFWWYRNILWASDLQVIYIYVRQKKICIRNILWASDLQVIYIYIYIYPTKKNMYPKYPLGL